MKIFAYVKITCQDIVKNFPLLLLSLSILPIGLVIIMGSFLKDTTSQGQLPDIEVAFIDEDGTTLSRELMNLLGNNETSSFIIITEDKSNYEILIPEGYERAMLNQEFLEIPVVVGEKGSSSYADLLIQTINLYNNELHKGIIISQKLAGQNISQEIQKEQMESIYRQLQQLNEEDLIEEHTIVSKKVFNSFEKYSISIYGFSYILLIMVFLASNFMEKDIGLYRRINSTPITRTQYYNYSSIGGFIGIFVFNVVYVLGLRFLNLSFAGSFIHLILTQLVMSLMGVGIIGLLWAFMSKGWAMFILNFLMLAHMIVNVALVPMMSETSFFNKIARFLPDILLTKTLNSYLLHGTINEAVPYLITMLGIGLICYLIGMIKANIRWRNE